MEKLIEELGKRGVSREALVKMEEKQVRALARAMKIDPTPFIPRKAAHIEEGKNGAKYVVTDNFNVPKFANRVLVNGENSLAKNLYLRVEAIDQAIADLQAAKELLK